jgi:hypothetical protein
MCCSGVRHSRSRQRTDQRVLVLTLKFLALTKSGFSPVKNTSKIFFDFYLPLFYATFQCRPYNIFKKKLNWFLPMKTLKNWPQKLLIIGPNLFFHSPAQPTAHNPQPRIDFLYYKYVPRHICLLICGVRTVHYTVSAQF